MSRQDRSPIDVAYYYPAPYWAHGESDWVKSLLLFFDRLAILLPGYMYGRHAAADPTLVAPLEERGLLQVLEPDDWVDESMTNELAEIIVELLTNGAFDDLSHDVHFHELSYQNGNLPTTLRHFPVQFSDPSFPPWAGSAPSTAVTGSARLIQTSTGSSGALGGPPTKRSGRAA